MRSAAWLLVAVLAAAPVAAQTTSPEAEEAPGQAEDRDKVRATLFEELQSATTEPEAILAEAAVWRFWLTPPSEEVGALMDRAMDRRRWYAFQEAREVLDQIVEQAPDYAEGWNQRAFILFLQENYDESLDDIERVLALEPKHFGALAGKARILMRQGRMELGQKALRQAVDIHPWLKERGMLLPEPGKDI
ncbi:MAG: tetratricopeptide repeat protein [Rhodobacteraceae bacterium]|nr:tetratricopeptide repeat protein [Paracoccaceae bacterium]